MVIHDSHGLGDSKGLELNHPLLSNHVPPVLSTQGAVKVDLQLFL